MGEKNNLSHFLGREKIAVSLNIVYEKKCAIKDDRYGDAELLEPTHLLTHYIFGLNVGNYNQSHSKDSCKMKMKFEF